MKTLMTAAAALALIAAAPQAAMATGGTAADKGLRGAAAAAAASEDAKTIGKIEIPDVTVSEPVEDASQAKPGLQPAGAPEKIGEIKTPDIEVKPPLKDRADAKPGLQAGPAAGMDESALEGADVIDASDENIGAFVKFIAPAPGAPTEAVIDVGGVLGLGAHRVAVPLSMVTFAVKDGETLVTVDATAAELKKLPEYES